MQSTSLTDSTSRRSTLTGSFAAIAAGMAVPAGAKAAITADPVVALYREYVALKDAGAETDQKWDRLHAELVTDYGDLSGPSQLLWGHDARNAQLTHLGLRTDKLFNERWDLADEMMHTPATTKAGAVAKLQIILDSWEGIDLNEVDHYERRTHSFVTDVVRLLRDETLF